MSFIKCILKLLALIFMSYRSRAAESMIAKCGDTYRLDQGNSILIFSKGLNEKLDCYYAFITNTSSVFRIHCRRFSLSLAGCDKERFTIDYKKHFCTSDFENPYYTSRQYLTIQHVRNKLKGKKQCSKGFMCTIAAIAESEIGQSTSEFEATTGISDTTEYVHPSGCVCGASDAEYDGTYPMARMVSDTESVPHIWPWLARIRIEKESEIGTLTYGCVGSLVSNMYVLSNARCIRRGMDKMFVFLGDHDVNKEEEGELWFIVTLESLYFANFDTATLQNDIMLIKLPKEVKFSKTISPICLYRGGLGEIFNKTVYIAGWGSESASSSEGSSVLKEVRMWVYELSFCMSYLSAGVPLYNGSLCWMNSGYGDCKDDDGAPGFYKRSDGCWEQMGLVSFTYSCAFPGLPSIGTRISYWFDWIHQQTGTLDWNYT